LLHGRRRFARTPADARAAIKLGAEGIGLRRTEHMLFDEAEFAPCARWFWRKTRKPAASRWENSCRCSRADFVELFKIMGGLPVTIRLLDPPLHEFLPHSEEEIAQVAQTMGADPKKLANRARELHEFNPMLGFRGCRLAIAYPEITEMQARAIFEAAVEAGRATGVPVTPEIMVPLIASKAELDLVKERIDATAETVASETKSKIKYQVGTMIELPRAALQAGKIAETAEFFSFGTNDLTQTTFGISRDDAASFLGIYTSKGILAVDPFVSIDRDGVGELVRIATERGRKVRQKLKLGICGEHGGDPASVSFCHELGLDYVSCSPFRVPIARLAAAQAALGRGASSQA
jgi:pyruvate,orthophosphate dikinase